MSTPAEYILVNNNIEGRVGPFKMKILTVAEEIFKLVNVCPLMLTVLIVAMTRSYLVLIVLLEHDSQRASRYTAFLLKGK